MRKFLELAEKGFVILSLTFFSGGFGIGATPTTPGLIPTSIITLIRYFIWFIAVLLICIHWKSALRTALRDIFLWILIGIILLSFIWSEFPEVTLSNSREVWQMASFGLYFATRFSLKEQVKLTAATFGIGALLSAVVALGLPSVGREVGIHQGAWKGIYDQKNTFGSMMVLGSLAFFILPIDKPRNRRYKWFGFGLSIAMMLLSTSKTALVLSLLLILILLFYHKFRWQGKITVIFLDLVVLVVGCVATVLFTNWVALLTGLGRDVTLSGRTLMWEVALTRLQERPWLGYGRDAFWAPGSKYAVQVGQAVAINFVAPHGHNGFIDLALDVGLIGLILFLLSFLTAYVWALVRAYATENVEDLWPLAFLTFLAMNNMTESYLLRLGNIYLVLYITAALSVRQRRQPKKLTTARMAKLTNGI